MLLGLRNLGIRRMATALGSYFRCIGCPLRGIESVGCVQVRAFVEESP